MPDRRTDERRPAAWEMPAGLVEAWRRAHPETVVLALAGSRARGDYGPASDVDLLAVTEAGAFRRIRDVYGGLALEAMCAPWSWFEHVVHVHERQSNVGTITDMLAHGRLLVGGGPRRERLVEAARQSFGRGPEPLGPDARERARERLLALLRTLCDADDEAVRRWLSYHLLLELADFAFKAAGWWQVKPRRTLAAWAEHDPATAERVRRAILEGLPPEALNRLVEDVARRS